MRRTLLLLLLFAGLFPASSFSQKLYIEPFVGFQKDLNNHHDYLFNTGLQLAVKFHKYELLVQVQKTLPHTARYTDSSYTLNTSLPLYAGAQKIVKPSSFAFGIGNRIQVGGRKPANRFYVKIYAGVMYQKNEISYQYDKSNYTIINPDKSTDMTGFYLSFGMEYIHQFSFGRFFTEINLSSPPLRGAKKYPTRFDSVAPLSLNIGYSIPLSKK